MSVLSDDTDVLLLIPPDFFLVQSDSEEEIVDLNKPTERLLFSDLITQMNDLEGRVCMIENQNILKDMPSYGSLQQLRYFGSADSLNVLHKPNYNSRSLQTTPLKTRTLPSPSRTWKRDVNKSPLKYPSRIEHQNMLTSNQYMNQREKDNELLKEIHNFFKHKNAKENDNGNLNNKLIEKENSVPDITENENLCLSTAVVNLNKVNDLLKQLEETQAEIEQKLKIKNLEEVKVEHLSDVSSKKLSNSIDITLNETTSVSKTPRRFLNFDQLCPKRGEKAVELSDEKFDKDAVPVEMKTNNENEVEIRHQRKDSETSSSNELPNLLSLCDLWCNEKRVDVTKLEDLKVLKQKYQEEKCRRQHCEELIQKLQFRLLEEQQKVTVAMKVDREKDEAISKLTEGWNKLVGHWKDIESQRSNVEKKLQLEREKFQNEISTACQTVKRYETELSKALDLAHGYKEKCELSEKERKTVLVNSNKEIEILKNDLQGAKDKLQKEHNQVEKLEKMMSTKEEYLNQTKSKICEMQNQARDMKKSLKNQQTELEILKHEIEKLKENLKEEKNRVSCLEQSKKCLQQSNEDLKKKEKTLKENMKSMTEQMEKIKVDLKEFYQEQVEKIVQEKLKEFQEQLSAAEKTLQNEIEEREKKVTEMAVKQVQQIVEKHVVEINLLEEKHNEEIELWKVKLARAEEKVIEMEKKLKDYSSHKTEIAQKLQNVMETQWQEALKIITASSPQHQKSPLNSARSDVDVELTRQNTFTMLSCGWGDGELNKDEVPLENDLLSDSSVTKALLEQLSQRNHLKNGASLNYRIDETPQKIETDSSELLKKYIQTLLERPPGLPVDECLDKSIDRSLLNTITEASSLLPWQRILSDQSSQANNDLGKTDYFKPSKESEMSWK